MFYRTLGDGKDCVCVFMKRLPFPEDVGLITWEQEEEEGKCEETKGCFSFGDLV